MPIPITPGPITAAEAHALTAWGESVEQSELALAALADDPRDELPARLTAWDAATQRASWTEEDFDATGARYVKPGGRTGSATYNPAVPVGSGLMPPDAFPVQVWLRRRIDDTSNGTDVGSVYEFDWVCACAGAGSGAGSGGTTGVLTACCPGAVPSTLTGTLAVTAGSCTGYGGSTVTLTWNGSTAWVGTVALGGLDTTFFMRCFAGVFDLSATGGCTWTTDGATALFSCAPLHVLFTKEYNAAGSGGCCAAGSTITLTVTE